MGQNFALEMLLEGIQAAEKIAQERAKVDAAATKSAETDNAGSTAQSDQATQKTKSR
jgi:hypothetical protein